MSETSQSKRSSRRNVLLPAAVETLPAHDDRWDYVVILMGREIDYSLNGRFAKESAALRAGNKALTDFCRRERARTEWAP